jgi:hypothetical protein
MVRRKRDEPVEPTGEKRVTADDERAGMLLDEGGESGIDFAFGAGLQDIEL